MSVNKPAIELISAWSGTEERLQNVVTILIVQATKVATTTYLRYSIPDGGCSLHVALAVELLVYMPQF